MPGIEQTQYFQIERLMETLLYHELWPLRSVSSSFYRMTCEKIQLPFIADRPSADWRISRVPELTGITIRSQFSEFRVCTVYFTKQGVDRGLYMWHSTSQNDGPNHIRRYDHYHLDMCDSGDLHRTWMNGSIYTRCPNLGRITAELTRDSWPFTFKCL